MASENPTLADLAAFLCTALSRRDQPTPATAPPAADGIGELFKQTVDAGRAAEPLT
ncbi:hypothetical protein [Kitasatospora sp. NPDC057223]|uniref:hypothetical protein n=1 Tax=Kitasatospora sp. NPDC057223 TaxID=3346055 RepID=UPI00362F0869